MKGGFYPKLAWDGIRKNKRMYIPYILTCIGMVMMFYIIMFLAACDALSFLPGTDALRSMFALGSVVIAIFAGIFLFYTNSFLIRRRKKEFGLYNILGMGKGNIGLILFWETVITALLALGIGLAAGILFSKLAELGLVFIMRGAVTYALSVSLLSIVRTLEVFGVIFALIFLNSMRQVRFSSAIQLLRSENAGERAPKGNWFIGLLGLLLLGAAYYLAVTIQDPIVALFTFFVAVVMVIIGTYLVMIAGSVVVCRILQKNKGYYYKPNHFVSVSSMRYRMKRNGASLASICILATMVLVMMATTTCLYFGEEDSIRARYPRDINLSFFMNDPADLSDENIGAIQNRVAEVVEDQFQATASNAYGYRSASVAGLLRGTEVETDVTALNSPELDTFTQVYEYYFIPLSDYNAITGKEERLTDGEVLLCSSKEYREDEISFHQGRTFQVKKHLDTLYTNGEEGSEITSSLYLSELVPTMVLVVPDLEAALQGLDELADYTGERMVTLKWLCNFDTDLEAEQEVELYHELYRVFLNDEAREERGYTHISFSSQVFEREDFYGIFGSLFYVGIILSIVFLLAAVLMIYYKQISEGYEDQARFEIMQKVGMTKKEIRRSINSQLLTVFFLPLVFAAVHLSFAFPIIQKLLLAFHLNNVMLFAATTLITFTVFALFYTVVYRITSNAYYQIVSGARE